MKISILPKWAFNIINYWRWFVPFWKTKKYTMIFVVFLTLLTIVFKTAYPIFLKYIIDYFEEGHTKVELFHLLYIFIAFIVVHSIFTHLLPAFRGVLNAILAALIRNKYYSIFTKSNYQFFQKFKTGDLLTRLTDDIDGNWDRIAWYSCSGVLRPLEAISLLSFNLAVMFHYHVELTLWSFLPLPFLVLILSKTEDKMVSYTEQKQKSISKCNEVLEAALSGIRILKSTQSEKDQIRKYQEVLNDRIEKEKKFLKINQLIQLLSMLVGHTGQVIVIFLGSVYVIKGQMTMGTLILFISYLTNMINPIWTMSWFYASSKQIFKYIDRLKETEQWKVKSSPLIMQRKSFDRFESLELKNISFAYKGRNILEDFSLTLSKGEKKAIMGPIACGKTTLLELILGYLPLEKGEILLNGVSIHEYKQADLTLKIGYIKQENILFSESIENNLLLGDNFSDQQILESLKTTFVDEEVLAFPDGLKTVLGQKGLTLSGGQKQRISMARTLIRTPELLLMDDVTAAMDAITEERFWPLFYKKFLHISAIIVTHRPNTAAKAHQIVKMC